MDKEQARFILQSFRPDGADAEDPDFAEALAAAAADRELGDWLAAERAQDAAFAAALSHLAIPHDLREHIIAVLKGDQSHPEAEFWDMDAAFIGALASVNPPAGLRDQIVTAMKVEQTTGSSLAKAKTAPRRVQGWLKTTAVAAALVLGAFVALEMTSGDGPGRPNLVAGTITLEQLEHDSIKVVSQESELAMRASKLDEISRYLSGKNVSTVSAEDLPRGLSDKDAVGCQLLHIDEKNVSLLCFNKDGKTVHLVVVPRADLDLKGKKLSDLATLKKGKGRCWQCPYTSVSVAAWENKDNAFLLLGEMKEEELRKFF